MMKYYGSGKRINSSRERSNMAETKKVVKGGFRATLALIISLIALVISIMAYTSSEREQDLNTRIQDLRATMEKLRQESAEQLNKLRNETGKTLEKMGQAVKQDKGTKD
jgi:uncharacterized protein YlxW (UPF0749 family)